MGHINIQNKKLPVKIKFSVYELVFIACMLE